MLVSWESRLAWSIRCFRIRIEVSTSPCSHNTLATSCCATASMSNPTARHSGTRSDKYVTLASDSCNAPCRLQIPEEETNASVSMLRTVPVPTRSESSRGVFVLNTWNRVSRQERIWRTSSKLDHHVNSAHAVGVRRYLLACLHPSLSAFHSIPSIEQMVWVADADYLVRFGQGCQCSQTRFGGY